MKRTFACLLMLLLLYALPVLGEVTGFPGRVCEGAPLLSISIVDTGEIDPATDDKILRADITAEDGSLSQSLLYRAVGMPIGAAGAGRMDDLNFDGYADLCLVTAAGARNVYTSFALWNPETGRFDEVYTDYPYLPEEQRFADDAEQLWLCN